MTHTINVPLARRVLEQILAAPARWTQGVWLERPYDPDDQSPTETVDNCSTSGCFAGWTVVLAGHKTEGSLILDVDGELQAEINRVYEGHDVGDTDPTVRTVAAARLGLTDRQAETLFNGTNTLGDLYGFLAAWSEGEIAVPDELPVWAEFDEDELHDFLNPSEGDEDDDDDEDD